MKTLLMISGIVMLILVAGCSDSDVIDEVVETVTAPVNASHCQNVSFFPGETFCEEFNSTYYPRENFIDDPFNKQVRCLDGNGEFHYYEARFKFMDGGWSVGNKEYKAKYRCV